MQRPSSTPPETVSDKAFAPAGGYAMERVAPRTAGSQVPGIQSVRLLPLGVEGTIVDISTRGALILCCKKLGTGMEVRIIFEGTCPPKPTSAKIVRSLVLAMGAAGELWYHVGVAFNTPIEFQAATRADRRIDERDELTGQSPTPPKFVNRW
jgi:hypothetical protein